jgi:hypothetical protein
VRRIVVILLVLLLAGVSAPLSAPAYDEGPGIRGVKGFANLVVMWRTWRDGDKIAITGGIRPVGNQSLHNLELRVRVLGSGGEDLGRATFAFFPTEIPPGMTLHQGLTIDVPPGKKPVRLAFIYAYYLEDDGNVLPSFEGFDVDLADLK